MACKPLQFIPQWLTMAFATLLVVGSGLLKEDGVPHIWHVDGNAHDSTEWDNNLYLFSQRIFNSRDLEFP
jgi:hypothetical protein